MKLSTSLNRGIAAGLLAATLVLALAPVAEARNHRRYKRVDSRHCDAPTRVIVRERGSAAPAIAGLIGGFILGAAVSHAQPVVVHERECAPPPPRYHYYDPYCDEYLADLDECRVHCRDHRHPRIVRVVEIETGRCVQDLRWRDGGWHEEDMDWDD